MACGDAYEYLVQAAGGRSRAKPYDTTFGAQLWCNEPDAQAWYAQATHVFNLQRSAWNALMERANAAADWTHTRDLDNNATAYEDEYFALAKPSAWMAFGAAGCGDAVQSYIANIDTGKCVLERLNHALAKMGGGTVDPGSAPAPGGEQAWVPWLVAGVAVAATVGLGWWALSRSRAPQLPAYWAAPVPGHAVAPAPMSAA